MIIIAAATTTLVAVYPENQKKKKKKKPDDMLQPNALPWLDTVHGQCVLKVYRRRLVTLSVLPP